MTVMTLEGVTPRRSAESTRGQAKLPPSSASTAGKTRTSQRRAVLGDKQAVQSNTSPTPGIPLLPFPSVVASSSSSTNAPLVVQQPQLGARGRPRKISRLITSASPSSPLASPLSTAAAGAGFARASASATTFPRPMTSTRNPETNAQQFEELVPLIARSRRDSLRRLSTSPSAAVPVSVSIPGGKMDVDRAERTGGVGAVTHGETSDDSLSPPPDEEEEIPEVEEAREVKQGDRDQDFQGRRGGLEEEEEEEEEEQEVEEQREEELQRVVVSRRKPSAIAKERQNSGDAPAIANRMVGRIARISARMGAAATEGDVDMEVDSPVSVHVAAPVGRRSKRQLEKEREIESAREVKVEAIEQEDVTMRSSVEVIGQMGMDTAGSPGSSPVKPVSARRSGRTRKISQRQRDAMASSVPAEDRPPSSSDGIHALQQPRCNLMIDPEPTPSLTTSYSAAPSPSSSGPSSPPPTDRETSALTGWEPHRGDSPGQMLLPGSDVLSGSSAAGMVKARLTSRSTGARGSIPAKATPVTRSLESGLPGPSAAAKVLSGGDVVMQAAHSSNTIVHTTRSARTHVEPTCAIPFPPTASSSTTSATRIPKRAKLGKEQVEGGSLTAEDLEDAKLMAVCAALDCQGNRALLPQEIAEYCFERGWLRPSPAVPPANAVTNIIRGHQRRCQTANPVRMPLLDSRKLHGSMTEIVFARALHSSVEEENRRVRGTVWFLRGTHDGFSWSDPFDSLGLDLEEMAMSTRRASKAPDVAGDGMPARTRKPSRKQIAKQIAMQKKQAQGANAGHAGLKIRINVAAVRMETNLALEAAADQANARSHEQSWTDRSRDSSSTSVESEDGDGSEVESDFYVSDADLSDDEDDSMDQDAPGLYWKAFSTSANAFSAASLIPRSGLSITAPSTAHAQASLNPTVNALRPSFTLMDTSSSEGEENGVDLEDDRETYSPMHSSGALWTSLDHSMFAESLPLGSIPQADEVDTPATTPGGSGECGEACATLSDTCDPCEPDMARLHAAVEMLAGLLPGGQTLERCEVEDATAMPEALKTKHGLVNYRSGRRPSQSAKDFLRITIPLPQGPAPSPLSSPSLLAMSGDGFAGDDAQFRGNASQGTTASDGSSADGGDFAIDLQRQLAIADPDQESICRVEPSPASDVFGFNGYSRADDAPPAFRPTRRSSTPLVRQVSTSSLATHRSTMESPSRPDRRRFPSAAPETVRGGASSPMSSPRLRNAMPADEAAFKQSLATLLGPESVGVEDLDSVWGQVQASMTTRSMRSRTISNRSIAGKRGSGKRARKQSITAWGTIGVGCPTSPELDRKQEKARFGQALLDRARMFAEQVSCQGGSSRAGLDDSMDDGESCIGMEDLDDAVAMAENDPADDASADDASMSGREYEESAFGFASPREMSMLSARHFTCLADTPVGISPGALSSGGDRTRNPFSPPLASSPFASTSNTLPSTPAAIVPTKASEQPRSCIEPCKRMSPHIHAVVYEGIPIFSVVRNGVTVVRRVDTDYVNLTGLILACCPLKLPTLVDEVPTLDHKKVIQGRSVDCLNGIWVPLHIATDVTTRLDVDKEFRDAFLAPDLAEHFPPPLPQVKACFVQRPLPSGSAAYDFGAPFGTCLPTPNGNSTSGQPPSSTTTPTSDLSRAGSPSGGKLSSGGGSICVPCKRGPTISLMSGASQSGSGSSSSSQGSGQQDGPPSKKCKLDTSGPDVISSTGGTCEDDADGEEGIVPCGGAFGNAE